MTKKILLALALSLTTASFTAPALACGGYGTIDPKINAISEVTYADARRRFGADAAFWVSGIELNTDGDRARARVHLTGRRGRALVQDIRLALRHDGWRVVARGRRHAA